MLNISFLVCTRVMGPDSLYCSEWRKISKSILCSVGKVIIFEHGCHISALKQVRMLILSSYVLLASINPIYKYSIFWLRSLMHVLIRHSYTRITNNVTLE